MILVKEITLRDSCDKIRFFGIGRKGGAYGICAFPSPDIPVDAVRPGFIHIGGGGLFHFQQGVSSGSIDQNE